MAHCVFVLAYSFYSTRVDVQFLGLNKESKRINKQEVVITNIKLSVGSVIDQQLLIRTLIEFSQACLPDYNLCCQTG